jgi:hypothetical protein
MIYHGKMVLKRKSGDRNHNDLYETEDILYKIIEILSEAKSLIKFFLNADTEFDRENLRHKLKMEEIMSNIKMNL